MNEKWLALEKPPQHAMKMIKSGRMAGKTDINPQWRYRAMTEVYGLCGTGWKWELVKVWLEPATNGEVLAFSQVNVYTYDGANWSAPIPGIGGNKMITSETKGLHNSDECFKMATTDALSVALKFLGVASLVYEGEEDCKYDNAGNEAGKAVDKDNTLERVTKITAAMMKDTELNKHMGQFLSGLNKTVIELTKAERVNFIDHANKIKKGSK